MIICLQQSANDLLGKLTYGPAYVTATQSSLASLKSKNDFYLSDAGLPRFSLKRGR